MHSIMRMVLPASRIVGPRIQSSLVPRMSLEATQRQFSIYPTLLGDRFKASPRSSSLRSLVRSRDWDESVNEVVNVDALAQVEETSDEIHKEEEHQIFPDENTPNTLFNGIRFDDLP